MMLGAAGRLRATEAILQAVSSNAIHFPTSATIPCREKTTPNFKNIFAMKEHK
jgi:hypothetical protein